MDANVNLFVVAESWNSPSRFCQFSDLSSTLAFGCLGILNTSFSNGARQLKTKVLNKSEN